MLLFLSTIYYFSLLKIMEAFSLKDFKVLKTLGQGSYSTVNLVKKINNNQPYALKIVKLDKLTHQDKEAALN